MNNLIFDNQEIYIIADTHGEFKALNSIIEKIDNCILVVAGDVGIGFKHITYYMDYFALLNKELTEKNITLLLLRGNHDNPDYFSEGLIEYSNVKLLKDYTVITVGDKNILCVGGAISIDREYRKGITQRKIYWENEAPIYREDLLNEINDMGFNIDYVITHTSPSFCFKNDKDSIHHFIKNDELLRKDLDNEREVLSKVYQFLVSKNNIIKKWIYGHFHCHNNEKINGIEFIALVNADYSIDYVMINK